MTCVWLLPANGLCSLWTVPPYIRFHVQGFLVTLRDGCLFFVVLNITRILHYVNLFFYFFLFFLYISHNCLFYYVFSDNLFFLKKNVLSHALFLYLCRHSQIVSLKQIHSQRP